MNKFQRILESSFDVYKDSDFEQEIVKNFALQDNNGAFRFAYDEKKKIFIVKDYDAKTTDEFVLVSKEGENSKLYKALLKYASSLYFGLAPVVLQDTIVRLCIPLIYEQDEE